ncbi:Fc.00g044980.m01.CDS01 [Cosmosporella sp. VM-42]
MSSFGRLQAALAAATNEVTVAAANINFDFTLVKYEAPAEFQPLGRLLATSRKQDAEGGNTHITARRLGALFEGVCPDTPNLIKAYGTRVSEISKEATEKEPIDFSKTIFAAYAGVDATSIWAAATSSKAAIHVHLLACMLAEMWEAPEAVSIWIELIAERRREITDRLERGESVQFSLAAAAAQQEISREQLAGWDSSARAWIETAKRVLLKQYTQLKLIVKNLPLTVNSNTVVGVSVTEAWKLALDTTEKLVSGMPQQVCNGAAILGLAAWHIYPDMCVLGTRNAHISMNDVLVAPGGTLTLGCSPSTDSSADGVYWSLCLSHLRHYGPPVHKQRSLQEDPSRMSFRNLRHATLGSLFTKWKVARTEVKMALQVFIMLSSELSQTAGLYWDSPGNMIIAAQECLDEREDTQRFFICGRRRPEFFQDPNFEEMGALKPFFGLQEPQVLLSTLDGNMPRAALLNRLAERVNLSNCFLVIFDVHASSEPVIISRGGDERPSKRTRGRQAYSRQKPIETWELLGSQLHHNDGTSHRVLDFWYGDIQSAAIYISLSPTTLVPAPPCITIADLLWCFSNFSLSRHTLLAAMCIKDPIFQTLFVISRVSTLFDSLPAVVRVRILGEPLMDHLWAQELFRFNTGNVGEGVHTKGKEPYVLSGYSDKTATSVLLQIAIGLVGGYEIPRRAIPPGIIGISTGDSIIVPSQLLRDPADCSCKDPLTRLLGNLGQPGFVVFSSPTDPMVAPIDEANWKIANMVDFDGKAEDMLGATSLHLSFTNWSRPLYSQDSLGAQAVGGVMMEAAISIREAGKWIGDVDAVSALRSSLVFTLHPEPPCSIHVVNAPPSTSMTSVECWDELRDLPPGIVVVKAHGNWVARLAAATYLAQSAKQGNKKIQRITLCPSRMCWACHEPKFPSNIYIY